MGFDDREADRPLRFSLVVNPPQRVPAALNGFVLWNAILLVMMVVTYGYLIGQFSFRKSHSVPAIEVTSQESAPTGAR
jgi:cytochrome c oxidase subunit 1